MPRIRVALPGVILLATAGVAAGGSTPTQAERGPPPSGLNEHRESTHDPDPVTSDTLYWCEHLQQSFAVVTRGDPPPPQAAEFARRGREMCARGRVREGILWLRHAIVLLASP